MVDVVIVLGVSGTGKSTVGQALAQRLGWRFLDADDYHSAANVAQMRQGIPLTDADRWPWLKNLHQVLVTQLAAGEKVVLACSALKQTYRLLLTGDLTGVQWVHLQGSMELICKRLQHRQGHFMPMALLRSQLQTLEPPAQALTLSIDQSVDEIVEEIIQQFGLRAGD